MKNIFKIFALSSLVVLGACDLFPTEESIVTMEDGVDARVTDIMKGYQDAMTSASYGWIFDVMTDEGYYQFHMMFGKDNMVTMYTDNFNYYEEFYNEPMTSTWNMRSLQRPVLSFDTYSYLHIINDPDDDISLGSNNMGLGTDFEFEVDDYTDGVFHLTGRVNRVPAFMRQATAAEYEKVKEGGLMDCVVEPQYYNEGMFNYFMVGDTQVAINLNGRSVDVSYASSDGSIKQGASNVIVDLDFNMQLEDPIEIEGDELSSISFKDGKFYAGLKGATKSVDAQDRPIIALHYMYGVGKPYSTMVNILSMYPSTKQADNPIAYYHSQSAKTMSLFGLSGGLEEVDMELIKTESGEDRLLMYALLGGRYDGWATYPITFNESGDQFTCTDLLFDDDMYGNFEYMASMAVQYASYGYGGLAYFVTYFMDTTFKIEWSSVKFGSYSMGQLTEVGGKGFFVGAMFN